MGAIAGFVGFIVVLGCFLTGAIMVFRKIAGWHRDSETLHGAPPIVNVKDLPQSRGITVIDESGKVIP